MPKYVLTHSEMEEKSNIIAIHSSSEPFDLAYNINSKLGLKLFRSSLDISFEKGVEKYMVYKNAFSEKGVNYWLYSNSFIEPSVNQNSGLLFNEDSFERFLIPELSRADFLIRRVGKDDSLDSFIKSLSLLPQISSCYLVSNKKIKSKRNLIFD